MSSNLIFIKATLKVCSENRATMFTFSNQTIRLSAKFLLIIVDPVLGLTYTYFEEKMRITAKIFRGMSYDNKERPISAETNSEEG